MFKRARRVPASLFESIPRFPGSFAFFSVKAFQNKLPFGRCAVVVPARNFKKAHSRNEIKRFVFRILKEKDLIGWDVVFYMKPTPFSKEAISKELILFSKKLNLHS